jgi:hypothetical protein
MEDARGELKESVHSELRNISDVKLEMLAKEVGGVKSDIEDLKLGIFRQINDSIKGDLKSIKEALNLNLAPTSN